MPILINPSLFSAVCNNFHLSPNEISELDKYYVLQWDSNYFLSQLSSDSHITHQDIKYTCICPPKTRLAFRLSPRQIRISFRAPKTETGISPICIIRDAYTSTNHLNLSYAKTI